MARDRHNVFTLQREQIAFARAPSRGSSEKNSSEYVERGSAQRADLAMRSSSGWRSSSNSCDIPPGFAVAAIFPPLTHARTTGTGERRTHRVYELFNRCEQPP